MVRKRLMKKKAIFALFMMFMLSVSGCGGASERAESISDRDFDRDYDESKGVVITLGGSTARCDSDAVEISGSTVTIKDEGTYILSGSLEDGMIIVDSDKEDKTQLVLDGVSIHSKTGAPITILQSDKVFITLAEGAVNSLSNGGSFTVMDDNNIDAVIYSKEDLTLNGEGSLTIDSPAGHGIVSKDELTFTGGTYDITSASHGLSGKDGVSIADGTFHITSGKDGVHAGGFFVVNGGDFTIAAGDDGLHADETLTVADGTIDISKSYEGLEGLHVEITDGTISLVAADDGINAAGGMDSSGFGTRPAGGAPEKNTSPGAVLAEDRPTGGAPEKNTSPGAAPAEDRPTGGAPGKSESTGSITISGGEISVTASGDGLDANGSITISGGNIVVIGPDYGDTATLDYDTTAVISGGTFIGTGAMSMARTFSDSGQGVVFVNVGNMSAGTELVLSDQSGTVVMTATPQMDFSVAIFSSPKLVSGETYTLKTGAITGDFKAQ